MCVDYLHKWLVAHTAVASLVVADLLRRVDVDPEEAAAGRPEAVPCFFWPKSEGSISDAC